MMRRAGMFGGVGDETVPVQCPPGYIVDAGECVEQGYGTRTCPEGYTLDAGECVEIGTGTRVPTVPPGFVSPGAVPVRLSHWDLEAQPFATYRIAAGDTFVGLAKTYLGDGSRWKDLWNTGSNRSKFPNPDWIASTGPLDMPEEAREKMIAWLKKGKKGRPGELTEKQIAETKSKAKYYAAAAVAAVAAVGLGVGIYAYNR